MISGKNEILEKDTLNRFLDTALSEKKLTIKNTNFNRIEKTAFEHVPPQEVEYLFLNNNLIDSIEMGAFSPLTSLKKLVLSYNCLNFVENKLFENLSNLEELEITNNEIKLIYPQAFHGLVKLRRLILANNKLENIYPDTFSGLKELDLLVLSQNSNIFEFFCCSSKENRSKAFPAFMIALYFFSVILSFT